MSMWQFIAAVEGWVRFHAPPSDKDGALSEADKQMLFEQIKSGA